MSPTLTYRLYQLPSAARYVPRGETGAPSSGAAPSKVSEGQSYNWQGYGLADWADLVRTADVSEPESFRAQLTVSGVCDWEITKRFASVSDAVRLYTTARTPGAVSVWHLTEPGETDITDDFMSGGWANLISYDVAGADGLLPDNRLDPAGNARGLIPSWAHRGGSGLVEDVRLNILPSGGAEVSIGATCWAKQLQQTVLSELPFGGSVSTPSLSLLLYWLAYTKAEYAPALVRDLPDNVTADERTADVAALGQAFREGNGLPVLMDTTRFDADNHYIAPEVQVADFDASRKSVSPVGKWLIVPVMTSAAFELETQLRDSGRYWTVGEGAHNMLTEFQRLAESTGLIFHTALPYIIFDRPGYKPTQTWDLSRQQVYGSGITAIKPQSTVWVGNHTDNLGIEEGSGRSLNLHFVDRQLSDIYGEIQTPFLSSAARFQNSSFVKFPRGVQVVGVEPAATLAQLRANPYYYSDLDTIRLMQEQALGLAVAEADNYVANIEMPYTAGTKYGSDWALGDIIQLSYDGVGLTPQPLIVRSAGLSLNAQGELRQQAGLGARATINPQWYAGQYEGLGR